MQEEREDLAALRALGFEDQELKELGLWTPAVGSPADLAEMYIRRSKKKDSLSSLREQIRRICGHAANENKRIRRVWFEQRSASKSYVRREEFENACAAIVDGGESRTLYVYKTSRLSRRGMGQVGLLLDKFEAKDARIYVVAEHIDSRRSRMILAILSEQAREQVSDLSQFTKLGIDANKRDGKWTGGLPPYGLRSVDGKLAHDPAEYPTARRIADELLTRQTPNWIASVLNYEGSRTRQGKLWTGTGIIGLAHSVGWAGLVPMRERLIHDDGEWRGNYHRNGEPLLDSKGEPVSCGEGVITYAEHTKIKAILTSRARHGDKDQGGRKGGKREIRYLGVGILRCGLCRDRMISTARNYRCHTRHVSGSAGCVGVNTMRARADKTVTRLWLAHILSLSPDSPTLHTIARGWLAYTDPEKEARKVHVTATLEAAVGREIKLRKDYYVLNKMAEADYDYLMRQLGDQIAGLKAELAELTKEADLSPLMDAEALAALWQTAGLAGQRALLEAALGPRGIEVLPATGKGDRRPLEDRLVIDWRDQEQDRATKLGENYLMHRANRTN
jgi:site-specific DNA recombinase